MKYGLQLAMGAAVCGRQALQEVAALAEELEYDSILMGDHIVIPKRITTPWPYDEYVKGRPPYEVYTDMAVLDPFDTVAFLAADSLKPTSVWIVLDNGRSTNGCVSIFYLVHQPLRST